MIDYSLVYYFISAETTRPSIRFKIVDIALQKTSESFLLVSNYFTFFSLNSDNL